PTRTGSGMSIGDRLLAASQSIAERWARRVHEESGNPQDSPTPPILSRNMPHFIASLGELFNRHAEHLPGQILSANFALLTSEAPLANDSPLAAILREYMLAREVIFEHLETTQPLDKQDRDRLY